MALHGSAWQCMADGQFLGWMRKLQLDTDRMCFGVGFGWIGLMDGELVPVSDRNSINVRKFSKQNEFLRKDPLVI